MSDPVTIRRLYGRSKGHKLRQGQAALVEKLLPQLSVPESGPINARTLFGDDRPLHFEIGFGSGEHLAYRADLLPDHGFIGAEPFLNGVVGALQQVREHHLANVRLHMGDALDMLERLPDGALRFVYLLHPDPWPKARHAKRRMVNHGPLDLIAAKLAAGRRIPARHRRSGLLPLVDDDHEPAPRLRMAGGKRERFPGPPRRLARDPLRGQGAAAGPRSLVLPLPARLTYPGGMFGAIYRPLRPEAIILVAAAIVVATAIYCVSYNALAGRSESFATGILWALVNVVPFYFAFEAGKRARSPVALAACLSAAFAASMLLQILASGWPSAPGFELVRRLPALLLVAGLLAGGQLLSSGKPRATAASRDSPLPLAPADVDWVSAAGNYVELRRGGRTVLHRAPLSHVQAELERHGFVRIHRSILVRRLAIARVRPNDVILHDGTSLKTGKRYRSTLH